MKNSCDVIRDLLPLYADDACSEGSKKMVEEHLAECQECGAMLRKLRSNEIEEGLQLEKQDVISYGVKQFKKRSATVGSTVSGVLLIPILVCLIINLTAGSAMGWFLIVLAAMAVAASLIVVPIMVPENKLFWTFCAFTVSLEILFAVICLVSHGNWFWLVSSAVLFGLALFFLPFLIRAKPVQKWIGKTNKFLFVLAVDAALFLNMMNTIRLHGQAGGNGFWTTVGLIAGITLVVLGVLKNRRNGK